MIPRTGGRAVLELDGEPGEPIRYRATLYLPTLTFTGTATLSATDGALTWSAWSPDAPPPPAWLINYAGMFLRSAWREYQKGIPLPRRINRWREEREG